MTMNLRTTLMAALAFGVLVVTSFAAPVAAHGDAPESADEHRDQAKERMEAQRSARENHTERRDAAKERYEDRCDDDADELNESQQEGCMKFKQFEDRSHKARRESHALLGAIAALERRIGRLEVREEMLQDKLDSGNFTGNETAESLQQKIDKIEEHQDRMVERLLHLQERLEALHAKWDAVRDHVEERRHRGADSDDDEVEDEDESESESGSQSSSESASGSESSSSSSPA